MMNKIDNFISIIMEALLADIFLQNSPVENICILLLVMLAYFADNTQMKQ